MLSHVQFFATPWTVTLQALLLIDFPRQEDGVGCHFLLQGIFPTQEIKPVYLVSPALTGRFFTTAPPGKPHQLGYGDLKKKVLIEV